MFRRALLVFLFAWLGLHCGALPGLPAEPDAGEALSLQAGVPDAGTADAGVWDAGDWDAGNPDAGTADAGAPDAGLDLDRDGLDDAFEASLAQAYLPVLAVHPQDGCPLGGIVYRARKHPLDPTLIFIVYDYLFERDCGITSHVGDDEVFAITVNPAVPAPLGITAVRAISHQGTVCERASACGSCDSLAPCENDAGRPFVYFSKDKHGSYVSLSRCNTLTCLDQCTVGMQLGVPLVNAGEPTAHLTENLTTSGFITAANGWTQASVRNFNPWGTENFGGAGNVASDLTDPAFDTPACR